MEGLEKYYEFSPSDQRLINAYLRPKIAGKDEVGSGSIHDADVTSDHPYNLVRKHAPARGSLTGGGDKGVWFFFSPKRYVGSGSRLRNRARTVLGVDGRKKGAWHTEGRKKTVPGTAGGYFQKLSYEEVTPSSGSVVKPGWLMVEYAIEEDHGGGGGMVLCKVYKSPRGPGGSSDVSSSSRKRKAACVVRQMQPVVEQMQRPCKRTHEEDSMFVVGNLLREDDLTATNTNAAAPAPAPAYQETEHMLGSGESMAAAADQCTRKTDQMPDGGQLRIQEDASRNEPHDETALDYPLQEDQPVPPCVGQTEDEDEDDVLEITFGEFMGSSAHDAGAVPPPCAAQPEDAGVSCVQMSEQKVVPADDDGGEIEFTLEELMMGSSTPGGYSSMPSPRTLTDDDEDDEDDDGMCGLACPPMDYAFLEALEELGPAIMEEEEEEDLACLAQLNFTSKAVFLENSFMSNSLGEAKLF